MSDPNTLLDRVRELNQRMALETNLGAIAVLGVRLSAAVSDLDALVTQEGRLPADWHAGLRRALAVPTTQG